MNAIGLHARETGTISPVGPTTRNVVTGYRRRAAAEKFDQQRSRGGRPGIAFLRAVLRTAHEPRQGTRKRESVAAARARARGDVAIAALFVRGKVSHEAIARIAAADVTALDGGAARVKLPKGSHVFEGAEAAALLELAAAAGAPDAPLIGISKRQIARRMAEAARAARA